VSARVQVVLGSPWKDAVIRHLEPRSPYRPWWYVDDVREGDRVVVVFDTEPRLVLTEVGRMDVDGAIAGLHHEWVFTDAVPASQIEADLPAAPAVVDGDAADALIAAVTRQRFAARPEDRFGMTTAAAARALLESRGRCTGCGTAFPLDRPGARGDHRPDGRGRVAGLACCALCFVRHEHACRRVRFVRRFQVLPPSGVPAVRSASQPTDRVRHAGVPLRAATVGRSPPLLCDVRALVVCAVWARLVAASLSLLLQHNERQQQ
jgi:hypothetical protein